MDDIRRERIGDATLILGDCREVLPTLGRLEAVVTDPPYGLGALWRGGLKEWPLGGGGEPKKWDMQISDAVPSIVDDAQEAIVWGGNNYVLPPRRGWLVWDKIVRNFSSGHVELAWTTLDQPTRAFNYSNGQLASEGKLHPTQKPVPLMEWCIQYLSPRSVVVDPFMGSGTTGVACARLGRKFIGIEIDEGYFEIACRRIESAYRQADLFVAPPVPAGEFQQLGLLP